jgi:enamine deaminase RidA (YjgF/YER057c/UK114 family)
MAFNVGRYAAMSEWFHDGLARHAPAATGVGNPGDDLVIHGLAAPYAGQGVQNPRQTAPTDYSARYGPRPPCFARATRVGHVLLVSGTAAITGEDSVAPDDLSRQLDLTLDHLAALAGGLANYRSLRAYVPRQADATPVSATLATRVPGIGRVTPIVTDLCRPELLVEIEGVAEESERL